MTLVWNRLHVGDSRHPSRADGSPILLIKPIEPNLSGVSATPDLVGVHCHANGMRLRDAFEQTMGGDRVSMNLVETVREKRGANRLMAPSRSLFTLLVGLDAEEVVRIFLRGRCDRSAAPVQTALMRTSSAKAQGRRLQQQVVARLLATFPDLDDSDVRSPAMGQNGDDVQLSARAREVIGEYSFECKNQERLSIHAAMEQCVRNAQGREPLVVFHRNRSETYVALRFEHLLRLIGAPQGSSKRSLREARKACEALLTALAPLDDADPPDDAPSGSETRADAGSADALPRVE